MNRSPRDVPCQCIRLSALDNSLYSKKKDRKIKVCLTVHTNAQTLQEVRVTDFLFSYA